MPVASRKARKTAAAESEHGAASPHLLYTTQRHRDHGRGTRRDKAIKQQLLTPCEEQAIVDFVLRADRNGFPARVKDLHHYAAVFLRGRAPQRRRKSSSKEQRQAPAKDWPQAFCKRHLELRVARLRALDWRRHEAPDWHFSCSKKGYMNSATNLEWMQKVFEPAMRERANGKPRILISDGFETHESLDVLKSCFANNIVPCRLPSHTSHKLQPCDVSHS